MIHVEQDTSGLWYICNPDGSKYDTQGYKTYAAARKACFWYMRRNK